MKFMNDELSKIVLRINICNVDCRVGCTIFEKFAWKQNPVWCYAVEYVAEYDFFCYFFYFLTCQNHLSICYL